MCVGSIPSYTTNPKNKSYEGPSSNHIANGIVLFAIYLKSEEMKTFKIIYSLSKNKANVGDKFKLDSGNREVVKITNRYVYLDNNNYYPVKMFNNWMRIALEIQKRDENSLIKKMKIDHLEKELRIMRKEVKADYDAKYRQPAVNRMGADTNLKLYIVLTGVGDTVKFYFSPTFKADAEDMELSYKSLHGTKYSAFAYGYYIQYKNNIALIGMYPFQNRNLSDKRKAFALACLKKETIDTFKVNVRLYQDMFDMFNIHDKERQLLSSSQEQPNQQEKKHWSGLSGDIATSSIDQAIDDMLAPDDFPF